VAEVADFEKKGLDPKEALRKATFRVFSDMPGSYGAGVDKSIDAKMWETSDDLGETYVEWGGYAYGRKTYGDDMRETFRGRLKKIGLVVQNVDSREHDILACVDYNAYMGGFTAAVKMASGVQPVTISGDGSDPERIKSRTIAEEAKHVFRSRILNPKWIEGLKRHGYKGAGDLSRTIDISFHWDATTQIIDDWMYERLADRYAFDADMREWFKSVNPYALQNITERLLEAISRGMWDTDQETKDRLEEIYLEIEGEIEEVTA
jgi:cobaltochelatase CobN